MRFLAVLLLCCLSVAPLRADQLSNRLRLMVPGEDAATVNERQFLYQRVRQLFVALEGDKVKRKSTKKRIRRINARLERDHFRNYKSGARLSDAFRNGNYNDATAALLTALAFEEFDVTYDAYVDHWDAYLVADPDGRKTKIYAPNHEKHEEQTETAFRRNYLELVRAAQVDELANLTEDGVTKAFVRYYYDPAKSLSFGQLTAFLQYRRAQASYRSGDHAAAVARLEVAMGKEERPAFLVLRKAAELQIRATTNPEVEGDINTLFSQWSEAPDNKYLPAAILQYFDEQQRLLLAENRLLETKELLEDYLKRAPAGRTQWTQDMTRLSQMRLLRHHFTSGDISEALRLAENLYELDPTNEEIKFVLAEIILDKLRRSRLTGGEFVRAITDAAQQYPFVRERNRFMDLQLREMAWNVRDHFEGDNLTAGNRELERFRRSLIGIGVDEERSIWTLTAFLAASNYHFRQEDYAQARAFVEEGLKYNANDAYLLHRRELLRKY